MIKDLFNNFVQIVVQSRIMTILAPYPKFGSIAFLDFELLNLNVHSNL
jgi:hypothetical protein